MTRFPTYPTDILDRADALLSSKYPDGIVDPALAILVCDAMMAQREVDAKRSESMADDWVGENGGAACIAVAKAIRGTE